MYVCTRICACLAVAAALFGCSANVQPTGGTVPAAAERFEPRPAAASAFTLANDDPSAGLRIVPAPAPICTTLWLSKQTIPPNISVVAPVKTSTRGACAGQTTTGTVTLAYGGDRSGIVAEFTKPPKGGWTVKKIGGSGKLSVVYTPSGGQNPQITCVKSKHAACTVTL